MKTVKIMTFNTQNCLSHPIPPDKHFDYDLMANAIKECDPDIVGLNEMRGEGPTTDFRSQVSILAEKTGYKYFYFAPAVSFDDIGPYGNAFMSKIPVKHTEIIPIPDPVEKKYNGYYETRSLFKAELECGLTVLVTHFGLNPDEVENAVNTVLANLKDEKCVFMGDLNLKPTSEFLLPIRERLNDAADKLTDNKFSWPSNSPKRKIDYIFVSKDITVKSADIPKIVASDHCPHTAEIEF